jgi:hypothetical protein
MLRFMVYIFSRNTYPFRGESHHSDEIIQVEGALVSVIGNISPLEVAALAIDLSF